MQPANQLWVHTSEERYGLPYSWGIGTVLEKTAVTIVDGQPVVYSLRRNSMDGHWDEVEISKTTVDGTRTVLYTGSLGLNRRGTTGEDNIIDWMKLEVHCDRLLLFGSHPYPGAAFPDIQGQRVFLFQFGLDGFPGASLSQTFINDDESPWWAPWIHARGGNSVATDMSGAGAEILMVDSLKFVAVVPYYETSGFTTTTSNHVAVYCIDALQGAITRQTFDYAGEDDPWSTTPKSWRDTDWHQVQRVGNSLVHSYQVNDAHAQDPGNRLNHYRYAVYTPDSSGTVAVQPTYTTVSTTHTKFVPSIYMNQDGTTNHLFDDPGPNGDLDNVLYYTNVPWEADAGQESPFLSVRDIDGSSNRLQFLRIENSSRTSVHRGAVLDVGVEYVADAEPGMLQPTQGYIMWFYVPDGNGGVVKHGPLSWNWYSDPPLTYAPKMGDDQTYAIPPLSVDVSSGSDGTNAWIAYNITRHTEYEASGPERAIVNSITGLIQVPAWYGAYDYSMCPGGVIPLRMRQRDDGLGSMGHARLNISSTYMDDGKKSRLGPEAK